MSYKTFKKNDVITIKSHEFMNYLLRVCDDRFYIRRVENYFDIDLTEYLDADSIINAFESWKFTYLGEDTEFHDDQLLNFEDEIDIYVEFLQSQRN